MVCVKNIFPIYRTTNQVFPIDTKNGLTDRLSLPVVLFRQKSTDLRAKVSTGFQTKQLSL